MTRRLLRVWMFTLALLASLAVTARSTAKPPDLPVDPNNEVAPLTPYDLMADASPPDPIVVTPMPPVVVARTQNPETVTIYHPVRPRLPLSVQETLAECVLLGAHPLLSLVPVSEWVKEEHTVEVISWPVESRDFYSVWDEHETILVHRRVRPNTPASELRTFKKCLLFWQHPLLSLVAASEWVEDEHPQEVISEPRPLGSGYRSGSPPLPNGRGSENPAASVCPYMCAPACDSHVHAVADEGMVRTVLQNLERLVEAEKLYQLANKLASCGKYKESLDCLTKVCGLCPGSRFEGMSVDLVGKIICRLCLGGSEEAEAEEEEDDVPPTQCLPCLPEGKDETKPLGKASHENDKGCCCTARDLEHRLLTAISVNCEDLPLRKLFWDLGELYGVKLAIDEAAIRKAGIDLERPVTLHLELVSLKTMLQFAARQVDNLSLVFKDDEVLVTSRSEARGKVVKKTYVVADILAGEVTSNSKYNLAKPDELIKLIEDVIEPRQWADKGGVGTIDYFPVSQALVVQHWGDVQEQVDDLLEAVRHLQAKEAVAVAEEQANLCCKAPGVAEQVTGLMKACHLALSCGCHQKAAELARQAYALDAERVAADPAVYKMQLLAVRMDKGAGCCEDCEPDDCCCPDKKSCPASCSACSKASNGQPVQCPINLGPICLHCYPGQCGSQARSPASGVEVVLELTDAQVGKAKPYLEVIEEEPETCEVPKAMAKPFCVRSSNTGNILSFDDLLLCFPGETWTELNAKTNQLRVLWRVRVGGAVYCVRYDDGDMSFGLTVSPACGGSESCEKK